MIFKLNQLKGIKDGTISLAFRRWDKPNVKEGSTTKTAMGVVVITKVKAVEEDAITQRDAVAAGYEDVGSLLKDLYKGTGQIFKINVQYLQEDPRIDLRETTALSDDEFQKLKSKLKRLDNTRGPWVMEVLRLIRRYPERRAGDLAEMMKMDKLDFKLNVRKLKNLGLTISHEIGYSISPLGDLVMERIKSI